MCLAIPALIESIENDQAVAVLAGNRIEINVTLLAGVRVGDWVLVHAGCAIAVIDEKDARETFEILRQMEELQ